MFESVNGNLKKVFFKYLLSGIGGAVIVSVYSIVDAIMVGQYEGPSGTAALSVVTPVWTIIFSIGLLFGAGGSVLMAEARGRGDKNTGDQIFTAAFITISAVTLFFWMLIIFLEDPLLRLFGADDALMPLAKGYMKWLRFGIPLFTMGEYLASFIRNDNAPAKSMAAVVAGGVFNIVGDYVFVFVFDMGIVGAGLATTLGQILCILILCSHFLSKKNTLKFVKVTHYAAHIKAVLVTGFSVFVVDLATGVLTVFYNNRIMFYLGSDALAVYGVIININMFAQSLSYGVGKAVQPIVSVNYGAGNADRIRRTAEYGWIAAFVIGVASAAVSVLLPVPLAGIFMKLTPEITEIAPFIIGVYGVSFLFLPLNIFAAYYFQSIRRPMYSLSVSLMRGIVMSGILVFVLPALFGGSFLWTVMPLTEAFTLILATLLWQKADKKLLLS